MALPRSDGAPKIVGRYAIYSPIASGGMATVHLGKLLGPAGFSRMVAIKQLHPHFARDPDFVAMFVEEARLAAFVQHPNVVPTLDVVATETDLFLVLEYVQGESLSRLTKIAELRHERIPVRIAAAIGGGLLHGVNAVHDARDERGAPLEIIHRDVSPQNVIVGVGGVAKLLDFGVAKAAGGLQDTGDGSLKGKIPYMAPELLRDGQATRQSDVYGAAVVIWEAVTGRRLFGGDSDAQVYAQVLAANVPNPSDVAPELPQALDRVIMRGLSPNPRERYATAREMALALEAAVRFASPPEVGAWVEDLARDALADRARKIAEMQSSSAIRRPVRARERSSPESAAPTLARPDTWQDDGPTFDQSSEEIRDDAPTLAYRASDEREDDMEETPLRGAPAFEPVVSTEPRPRSLSMPTPPAPWLYQDAARAVSRASDTGSAPLSPIGAPPEVQILDPDAGRSGRAAWIVGILSALSVFFVFGGVVLYQRGVLPWPPRASGTESSQADGARATHIEKTAAGAETSEPEPAPTTTEKLGSPEEAAPSIAASGERVAPSATSPAGKPTANTEATAKEPAPSPKSPAAATKPVAKPTTTSTPVSTRVVPTKRPTPAAKPPKPVQKRVDCDPPYVRDEQGVKIYKDECL